MKRTIKHQELIISFFTDADFENKTLDTQRYTKGLYSAIDNKLKEMDVIHSNLSISIKSKE